MRFFRENIGWKLGSLLLAVLLWFSVMGEPELVTTHNAPILYKNLPRDLLIGSDALDQVRVELRGPSGKLNPEELTTTAVVLDLSVVNGPGERTFTLSDADFHLPQGVSFLRAVPSQLRMHFSRMMSREVPVEIQILKPPPPGYRIVREESIPDKERVAGPEGRVSAVLSAETDAIDLSNVRQNTEIRVNTYISDPQVRLESQPAVTVRIVIGKTGNQ